MEYLRGYIYLTIQAVAVEDDAANLEAVLDPQGEEEVQHEEATEDAEGEEAPQEEGEPEAGDEGT